MTTPLRVLIVEDSLDDLEILLLNLRRFGFEPQSQHVDNEADYLKHLSGDLDIIFADFSLPNFDAARALELMKARGLEVPFIVVSGAIGEDIAVSIMKQGASDYLLKDRLARLGSAVNQVLEQKRLRTERQRAEKALLESEDRLRIALEAANLGNWLWDIESQAMWWSDHTKKLLNVDLDCSPSYELFLSIVCPEDRDQVEREISRSLRTGTDYRVEYCITPSSGENRWLLAAGRTYLSSSGTPLRMAGVLMDITKRKQREEDAKRHEAHLEELVNKRTQELRDLSSHLETIREQEKTNIAREIHDELGGTLTALGMDAAWLKAKLLDHFPQLVEKVDTMAKLIQSASQAIRKIQTQLRPTLLDDLGLVAALEWHANEFYKRTGIKCVLNTQAQSKDFSSAYTTTLFRVFQEALTNVAKHAHASRVEASLIKSNGQVIMEVTDDGLGIRPDDLTKRSVHGIRGIMERTKFLGGEVRVSGKPAQGTTLLVTLPIYES